MPTIPAAALALALFSTPALDPLAGSIPVRDEGTSPWFASCKSIALKNAHGDTLRGTVCRRRADRVAPIEGAAA